MIEHDSDNLIKLFNGVFKGPYNTVLVKGNDEPIYLPADGDAPYHRVIFAHGFFASAMHEISHWCIAGEARRQLVDFGYWYKPDGRTAEEQTQFEQVEVKPQALEWILSQAAGHKFHFSADNLGSDIGASEEFKQKVLLQVKNYLRDGLPERPEKLVDEFSAYYKTPALTETDFSLVGK